jgi:hypothetical protein
MAINSTPPIPQSSPSLQVPNPVKPATPDLIIVPPDTVPVEIMTDLIFEDIGGHEIITISRSDLVNGENVIYSPIKNLSAIFFQYNPQNVLALQKTSDSYFKNFPIKLSDRIPECGTGYTLDPLDPTKEIPNCKIVYTDPITGDIVINVINMGKEEQVEVQILQQGIVLSDTIYEVE